MPLRNCSLYFVSSLENQYSYLENRNKMITVPYKCTVRGQHDLRVMALVSECVSYKPADLHEFRITFENGITQMKSSNNQSFELTYSLVVKCSHTIELWKWGKNGKQTKLLAIISN